MLAMALPWLLVLELVLYAGCFICGIITAASLTVTQGHFDGKCILYGSVFYNGSTQSVGLDSTSAPSVCYFVSAISVCLAVYCFSLILYWIYASCADDEVRRMILKVANPPKGCCMVSCVDVNRGWCRCVSAGSCQRQPSPFRKKGVWVNVTLCISVIPLCLLLVSGCVLKIGRDKLCLSVIHIVPQLTSCEEAENRTWTSPYAGRQFYTGLHSAEKSVWVNFFFWVLIVAVVFVQRHQGVELTAGGGNQNWSPSETEPFLHRPARPQ